MKGMIVILPDGGAGIQKYDVEAGGRRCLSGPITPIVVGDEVKVLGKWHKVLPHPSTGNPSIDPVTTKFGLVYQPVRLFAGRPAEHRPQTQGGG